MKKLLLLVIFVFNTSMYGQFKNSDEKAVYSIDNGKVNRVKFSGGETSLEFNIYGWTQPYTSSDTLNVTSRKKNAITGKLGLTNTKKFIDLDEFELSEQGLIFGVGFLHSFDEAITSANSTKFNLWTFKGGLEYKYDNFINYDPLTKNSSRKKPITYSISASATYYIFQFGETVFAPSISGTFNPKTYNSTSLINFKQLDGTMLTPENVAVFKDFDGKYGTLDREVTGGSTAIALPIFFNYSPRRLIPYIVPVPYISSQYLSSASPKYHAGLAVGFFSKAVFESLISKKVKIPIDKRSTEANFERDSRTFNSPTFLTVGVDRSYQSNAKSDLNFFITGAITFE